MDLTLDPRRTALVLIDLQAGILSRPLAPHGATPILERALLLAERLHEAGGIVVPVHVAFAPDGGDRPMQPVDSPMAVPPGGLPADFAAFAPEIAALPAAFTITKRQWGAFHGTELDLQLRRRGINTIVLGGVATNFGVEQTAREAWQHHYAVVLAEDACTSLDAEMHRFSVERIMPRLARVRSTADILAALPAA